MISKCTLWPGRLICCALALTIISCQSKTESDQPETASQADIAEPPAEEQSPQLTDEQILLLADILPLGTSYEQVRQTFPEISQLAYESGMEGLARRGLYEAKVKLLILDQDASIEFNFRHDSLYSCYFFIMNLDPDTCSALYKQVQDFYSARFGEFEEEKKENAGVIGYTSFWLPEQYDLAVSSNAYLGRSNILGWGFQEKGTLRPRQDAP